MLTKLQIQNFKIWKNTGELRMAPITLFFGANSSGKSSIGQFLMLLKQTAQSSDRRAVFFPGGRDSAVQLGSYREMVFGHNLQNRISFNYRWDLAQPLQIKKPASRKFYEGNAIEFEADIGSVGKGQQHALCVNRLNYQLYSESRKKPVFDIGMETTAQPSSNRDETEYKVTVKTPNDYKLIGNRGRRWPLGAPLRFYGFPDEVVTYYQNTDFVQDFNLEQEKLFQSLYYLGPMRTKAERLYSWGGTAPEAVGYAGENTIAAILAAGNRKITLGRLPKKPAEAAVSFQELIAKKLLDMELIEKFKVEPISTGRQEYEVKVSVKGSENWVHLPDVGYGISQVLPVLVQCFYAPPGSIIIMEQPEIHLHPSAQAALADVMIDVIRAREKNRDRNIQLIIETHSEHFLRRLQRRLAENVISEEKVAAYFANISKPPATLERLRLDRYGNIGNWPENFFGDEMGDIVGQAQAALKRRNAHLERMGIFSVPLLKKGLFSLEKLKLLLAQSQLGATAAEGIYLRFDRRAWLGERAKLVSPAFIQSVEQHWRRAPMETNRLQQA